MDPKERLLKQLRPLIGGDANIRRCETKSSCLFVVVKDRGLVNLEAIQELDGIRAVTLERARLKVTAPELDTKQNEQITEEMKMSSKYEELSDKIVGLLGGKENITFFTHCVTRLRFNVKDKNVIDLEAVKKLPGALGAQWSGDQLQVVIGQSVGDAYDLICKKYGFAAEKAVDENLDGGKNKISAAGILDYISGCISPLIPLLMAGGFLKIVVILGEQFGLLAAGMPTHTVLSFCGDAALYFLPIFIGATTARKAGANMALGMMVGAFFVHPSFIAALAEGPLSVFSIPVYNASYSSSIFPALLSVTVMAPIEKFFAKHSPDVIRSITEPFFTMLVMIPLSLCLLGPVGAFLGNYIAAAIMWLYNTLGFIGVAVFASLCPLLVMTGMHTGMATYMVTALTTVGWEGIMLPGMVISNIDQGAACLAVALKTKDKDRRATAMGCAITAMLGGVTEPAMFGITLPLRTPLYAGMIGTLCGGAIAGILGARAYAICTSGGLLGGIPVYLGGGTANVIAIIAGIGVGVVVTFIATMVLYKDPQ